MRKNKWIAAMVIGAAFACQAPAADPAPKAADDDAPQMPGQEERCAICGAKHAVTDAIPWLKVGADFRARAIYQENTGLVRHGAATARRRWQRFRTRLWATASPIDNLDINFRIVNEMRNYNKPKGGVGGYSRDFQPDEILIDKLNATFTNPGDLPIVVTIGRQDIKLGDGWLVFEGTPLDGSRTLYLDAVRGTIDLADYKSTLDLVYIDQAADTDRFIKPIEDQRRVVTNQDERGVIVYLSNKSLEHTVVDGYFIYKHDMPIAEGPRTAITGGTSRSEIYTFGLRAAGDLDDTWNYRAEIAPQFGNKNRKNINALGGRARLTYKTNDTLESKLFADYEYRSGGKTANSNFDILWGRYVQFSNAYSTYASALEGPPEMASNMHRAGIGWEMTPMEDMTVTTAYNALFADNNNQPRPNFSENGHFRGHVVSSMIEHKINEHVAHHLTGEVFVPGNYYSENRNSTAVFARYEIVFSW